ncbi:MAG: sigma-70 family RNA polymerase sigma factor [Planctomycetota bacterium]
MRSVLADHARAKRAAKRGGARRREPLDAAAAWFEDNRIDLLALDEAMTRFARVDERACRIVELRYFAGLTQTEIAELLGLSIATVERDWAAARGWLRRQLEDGPSDA